MHKWDVQEALRLIEEERITWFTGVPTMSAELQAAAEIRIATCPPSPRSTPAAPRARRRRSRSWPRPSRSPPPGIGYGLTETNALGTVNSGDIYRAVPAAPAAPCPRSPISRSSTSTASPAGGRARRGLHAVPGQLLGYWNKPEATAEAFRDGWFHTGDVGYLDEDGFLFIVDRMKEIIIRGGENISCIEVEAAIYQHPAWPRPRSSACRTSVSAKPWRRAWCSGRARPSTPRSCATSCASTSRLQAARARAFPRRGAAAHRHGQDFQAPAQGRAQRTPGG
jgi:long-chain acyl-CoA synthetase